MQQAQKGVVELQMMVQRCDDMECDHRRCRSREAE